MVVVRFTTRSMVDTVMVIDEMDFVGLSNCFQEVGEDFRNKENIDLYAKVGLINSLPPSGQDSYEFSFVPTAFQYASHT